MKGVHQCFNAELNMGNIVLVSIATSTALFQQWVGFATLRALESVLLYVTTTVASASKPKKHLVPNEPSLLSS